MSQWVKTDLVFGERAAILTISSRLLASRSSLSLPSLAEAGSQDEVERIVLDVIAELRPDLEGGVLYSMKYNMGGLCWEFYYIHPSLPVHREMGYPETQPLIKE